VNRFELPLQRFIRIAIEVARDSHIQGIVVSVRSDLMIEACYAAQQLGAREQGGCVMIDNVTLTVLEENQQPEQIHFGYRVPPVPPGWYETTVKLRDELNRRFKGLVN